MSQEEQMIEGDTYIIRDFLTPNNRGFYVGRFICRVSEILYEFDMVLYYDEENPQRELIYQWIGNHTFSSLNYRFKLRNRDGGSRYKSNKKKKVKKNKSTKKKVKTKSINK